VNAIGNNLNSENSVTSNVNSGNTALQVNNTNIETNNIIGNNVNSNNQQSANVNSGNTNMAPAYDPAPTDVTWK
jgi:hypothetical protein